jgi:ABC-type Na+ efflux pump permease subunit
MISAKEVFVFMFPGIMYFWVFFIGQGPMQEILTERDTHTLHRLLASPVSLFQFLLSKMIRCFLLCGSIQLLLLLASAGLAGIWWGDPFLLVLVVLACPFGNRTAGRHPCPGQDQGAGVLVVLGNRRCLRAVGGQLLPF